jgi:hypothetical protein
MNASSIVTALARRWAAIYTFGLPRELRDRRREEIAGDLWEQQHDDADDPGLHRSAASLAGRVCSGMAADILWRAGERRPLRRLELANLAIDRAWDRRMRRVAHGVVLAAVAWFVPIAVGLPVLLVATLPAAAFAAWRANFADKRGEVVSNTAVLTRQRRTRFIVVAVASAVWLIGLLINSLPNEELHDRYWYFFLAPSMTGFMVGVVALPMLVWSLLPRRDTPTLDR